MKNHKSAYVGLVVSALFILLVLYQVDLASIGQVLRRTSSFWLITALMFYWVEILLRIIRWKRILISMGTTARYPLISNSFCISAAANNIFPLRIGDILRAHLVGIQGKTSRSSLMGTIVLEKLIDFAAVLLLTFWGALGTLSRLGALHKVGLVFLIGTSVLLLTGVSYMLVKKRFKSNGIAIFFHERFGHFKKGFSILLEPKNLLLIFLETVLIWSFNTLAIWAIIKSLGPTLSISEMLLLEGIAGLAAAIPSAPAGIGTLQYAFVLTFGVMHLDKSTGVAASLLVQGVLLGSITLVGMLIFTFDSKSRKALGRIRHE